MRIYIIGNDGVTLCREAPTTLNDGEIAVASRAGSDGIHGLAGSYQYRRESDAKNA